MKGGVDVVGYLDGHPSKYSPGPMLINFDDHTNAVNHYTTPPTIVLTYFFFVFRWYGLGQSQIQYDRDTNLLCTEPFKRLETLLSI